MNTANQVWNSSRSQFLHGTGGFPTKARVWASLFSGVPFAVQGLNGDTARMSMGRGRRAGCWQLSASPSVSALVLGSPSVGPPQSQLLCKHPEVMLNDNGSPFHSMAVSTRHRARVLPVCLGLWCRHTSLWESSAPGSDFAENFQSACFLRALLGVRASQPRLHLIRAHKGFLSGSAAQAACSRPRS